jgi:uncharacterized protein (TIGR00730 family)
MRGHKPADGEEPSKIPPPAHPSIRRAPLPWQRPKGEEEDPGAPDRIAAILRSPSYREAEHDPDFLQRDDLRGLRLQLEFLKPELLLTEHGIRDTIVVLGSTRILEPVAAARQVEMLKARVSAEPGNVDVERALAVAERVQANSRYYDVAREFGRLVGTEGSSIPRPAVIVTGGGPGIMEAANRGAFDAGAKTVGLNITLPHEQYPNPYITPELCFSFRYFALRKLHFLHRARAMVAFPGGYGTFDELFETLALIQTRKVRPIPVVLVGEAWWRRAFDVDFLVAEGTIDEEDRELFWYAETAREIWDGIRQWHAASTDVS